MSAARRMLIAANWKMHGLREPGVALAGEVAAGVAGAVAAGVEVVICPPATLLLPIGARLAGSGLGLGAQDCHEKGAGAFTGDIAAPMLKDAGCSHVIVGHSERRSFHHESSAAVRAKAEAALAEGLVALVCVGETADERDAGRALDVVSTQVDQSLPDSCAPESVVIAYEPVWAIGTGRVAGVADIDQMHRHIRNLLIERFARGGEVRILYGGSVKPANAAAVLAVPDVDGALVGGASLDAADFTAIVEAAPRR